ncbi:hypothetical protein [Escherichia coli]|uniref:hypothetical protein n=1 Tax=Escherichia coli TaxID=562 RepID=UPI00226E1B25|nr:hypothetical protein [Escherichia coli]MCY0121761.1 hypothetical protein [Escherichia coli]
MQKGEEKKKRRGGGKKKKRQRGLEVRGSGRGIRPRRMNTYRRRMVINKGKENEILEKKRKRK